LNKITKDDYIKSCLKLINSLFERKVELTQSEKAFLDTYTGKSNFIEAKSTTKDTSSTILKDAK